ncbi:MAG: hypothetical protein QM778_33240 [Myxococcales bacterium]
MHSLKSMRLRKVVFKRPVADPALDTGGGPNSGQDIFEAEKGYELELRGPVVAVSARSRTYVVPLDDLDHGVQFTEPPAEMPKAPTSKAARK